MLQKIIQLGLVISFVCATVIVTAQECNTAIIASTSGHFTDNKNGTITDNTTSLIWKKCSEGQIWNNVTNNCDGFANTYTWQGALQVAQVPVETFGQSDWRVPNIKELSSIVERRCIESAIDESFFPNTPSYIDEIYTASPYAWSSTVTIGNLVWYISFDDGEDYTTSQDGSGFDHHVRLVRSGQ